MDRLRTGATSARAFMLLWGSQSVSLLGLQFGILAFPLVAITTLNASASEVAILNGLTMAPWLLLGLLAGVVVDRLDRRRVLVLSHLGRALNVGLVPPLAILDALTIWQLYAIALVNGLFSMIFEIAYHSYLPSLVRRTDLAERNARLSITDGLSRTAGPGLAGAAVQALTAPFALIFQSVTYAASAALLLRIPHRPELRAVEKERSPIRQFLYGISYTFHQATLRALIAADASYLFFYNLTFATVLVFYTEAIGLSATTIGLLYATGSAGGILGGLTARKVGGKVRLASIFWASSLLRAVGLVAIPIALVLGGLAPAFLALTRLVNAFGWTVWEVHRNTFVQGSAPVGVLGRVNGSSLYLSRGAESLGAFSAAGLATVLGVTPTILLGGLFAVLGVGWLAMGRSFEDRDL